MINVFNCLNYYEILVKKSKKKAVRRPLFNIEIEQNYFFSLIAAWAAAKRAIGTRNGEQLT